MDAAIYAQISDFVLFTSSINVSVRKQEYSAILHYGKRYIDQQIVCLCESISAGLIK